MGRPATPSFGAGGETVEGASFATGDPRSDPTPTWSGAERAGMSGVAVIRSTARQAMFRPDGGRTSRQEVEGAASGLTANSRRASRGWPGPSHPEGEQQPNAPVTDRADPPRVRAARICTTGGLRPGSFSLMRTPGVEPRLSGQI
jgi:hypothetical protein